jgi:hypothetical protein
MSTYRLRRSLPQTLSHTSWRQLLADEGGADGSGIDRGCGRCAGNTKKAQNTKQRHEELEKLTCALDG